MSLSKKIAAALDENTKAYVLPCTVTVEESPEPPDVAPHGPRHGRPGLHRAGVRHDQPSRVVLGRAQGLGRPAGQPGDLPDGAAQGPRDRRRGGRGPDPQPEPDPSRRPTRLLRDPALPAREPANGTVRLRRGHPPAPPRPPASSRARSWSGWPTTSPPAWAESKSQPTAEAAAARRSQISLPPSRSARDGADSARRSRPMVLRPGEDLRDRQPGGVLELLEWTVRTIPASESIIAAARAGSTRAAASKTSHPLNIDPQSSRPIRRADGPVGEPIEDLAADLAVVAGDHRGDAGARRCRRSRRGHSGRGSAAGAPAFARGIRRVSRASTCSTIGRSPAAAVQAMPRPSQSSFPDATAWSSTSNASSSSRTAAAWSPLVFSRARAIAPRARARWR